VKTILRKYVDAFDLGCDLDGGDAESLLDGLISETDDRILADLFHAWDRKGIAEDEIYELAQLMRDRCTRVVTKHESFVDIVGTGGSRSKTFNVSTAAAFVIAGGGVPVAKHGNRAATSNSGSADVLSALGVEPAVAPETAERCLDEIGICFMFAPNFHRLSPTLANVRRGLGFPTIFNCIGPLCNPANAPHQVIGVWSEEMVAKMANALRRLGTRKSWVVHGRDGLDEISLAGATLVAEVENGAVNTFEIDPGDCSLDPRPLTELRVRSADESATVIRGILDGEDELSAATDIVRLNAAAAFFVSGRTEGLLEGSHLAAECIRDGKAKLKLDQLADLVKG
jgi:anthranilate phosphoribosyltransferase